jgi:hypothetical protein
LEQLFLKKILNWRNFVEKRNQKLKKLEIEVIFGGFFNYQK